jgi:hypothetical protein
MQKEQHTLSVRVAAGAWVPELVMIVRVNLTSRGVKVTLTACGHIRVARTTDRSGLKIVVWGLQLAPHVLILGYEYLRTSPRKR